jgi:hypothetical protein
LDDLSWDDLSSAFSRCKSGTVNGESDFGRLDIYFAGFGATDFDLGSGIPLLAHFFSTKNEG